MKIADLCKSCQAISSIKAAVRKRKEAGIFTDADDKFLADSDKEMMNLKEKLTKALEAAPPKGKPIAKTGWDEEKEEELNGFFCSMLQEGDINVKGNANLSAAFIKKVPLDYPALCEERCLLSEMAADGNLVFLDQLLGIPGNDQFDKIDLLTSALYSQLYRIPATLILLKHPKVAFNDFKDEDINEEAKSLFQEFFIEIGNTKKANVRENRTGRIELFDKLINNKALDLDVEEEGDDCQTVVSRAAYNGDADLLALLFGCKKVKDINRIQPDRTTALIQAVFANSVECVMTILSQKGVDVNYEADDGNAMSLATVLQRDPTIVAILKKHGGKEGEKSPLGNLKKLQSKLPPETPAAPAPADAAPVVAVAAKAAPTSPSPKKPAGPKPTTPPPAAPGKKKPPAPTSGKKSSSSLKSTDSSNDVKKPAPKAAGKKVSSAAPKPTPPPGKPPMARGRGGGGPSIPSSTSTGPLLVTSGTPDYDSMTPAFKNSITLVSMTFYRWVNAASRTQQLKRQQMILKIIVNAKGKPMEKCMMRSAFRLWLRVAYRSRAGKMAVKKILGGMASDTRRASLMEAGTMPTMPPARAGRGGAASGGGRGAGSSTSLLKGGGRGGGGAAGRAAVSAPGGKMSIADMLSMIHLSKLSIQSRVSMGIFTDEEEAKQKETEKEIMQHKRDLQSELTDKYKKKKLQYEPGDEDERDHIETLVDDLLKEADTKDDNASLFKLLLECVKLDWPTLCEDKGYLSSAACDGSTEYMQSLLSFPHIKFDVVDVVLSSLYNQTHRIPSVTLLLRHERVLMDLGFEDSLDELMDAFHEFIADIASHKRSDNPKEIRTGRLQLIEKLYTHKIIKLDVCAEGSSDSQTVFSRAAFEGDHELMSLLLKIRRAPDINRVQSNRTTALIQAVISNSVAAVALILAQSGVDVNYISPDGSALTMGIMLKRDLGIVQKLKSMGAKQHDGCSLPPIKPSSAEGDNENDVHGISSSEQETGTPGATAKTARKSNAGGAVKLPTVTKKVHPAGGDDEDTDKPAEKKKPIKTMAAAAVGGKVKKKF